MLESNANSWLFYLLQESAALHPPTRQMKMSNACDIFAAQQCRMTEWAEFRSCQPVAHAENIPVPRAKLFISTIEANIKSYRTVRAKCAV